MKVGYLMTWGPYSLVSMYSAFISPNHITPLDSTLPAMFAKSSLAWSTILFIYSNKKIKSRVKFRLFSTKQHEINTRQSNYDFIN